jgi:hypothetical protein
MPLVMRTLQSPRGSDLQAKSQNRAILTVSHERDSGTNPGEHRQPSTVRNTEYPNSSEPHAA